MAERQKDDSILIDDIKLDEEKSDEISKYDGNATQAGRTGAKFVFTCDCCRWPICIRPSGFSSRTKSSHVGVALVLILLCIRPKRQPKQ